MTCSSLICVAEVCHTIFQIAFSTLQISVLQPHVQTKEDVLWMGHSLLASDVCVLLNGLEIHALNVSTKISIHIAIILELKKGSSGWATEVQALMCTVSGPSHLSQGLVLSVARLRC